MNRIALGLLLLFVAEPAAARRGRTTRVPREARAVIRAAQKAAKRRDLAALRDLMVREFTWSFGGDMDREQALEEWAKDPKYLRELAYVLRRRCRRTQRARIECPPDAGMSFRAHFVKRGGRWVMEAFVAGD